MSRGSALLEFAIAWPVSLLLVAGCIQLAVWGSESFAAREAALAGAHAGTVAGSGADAAATVTIAALGRSLVGVRARRWCPGSTDLAPEVWVCARLRNGSVQVVVAGTVPALLPLVPGGHGLPIRASVVLSQETFRP